MVEFPCCLASYEDGGPDGILKVVCMLTMSKNASEQRVYVRFVRLEETQFSLVIGKPRNLDSTRLDAGLSCG